MPVYNFLVSGPDLLVFLRLVAVDTIREVGRQKCPRLSRTAIARGIVLQCTIIIIIYCGTTVVTGTLGVVGILGQKKKKMSEKRVFDHFESVGFGAGDTVDDAFLTLWEYSSVTGDIHTSSA